MPRGRTQSWRAIAKIVALAEIKTPATEILKALKDDQQLYENDRYIGPADVRTVRDIAREHMPQDPSAPWTVVAAPVEEARIVLPVLSDLIATTRGQVGSLSIAVAERIYKLKSAAPDLLPISAYRLALAYLKRE
jgi:hypothetical protein